jgi:hypothetical protein
MISGRTTRPSPTTRLADGSPIPARRLPGVLVCYGCSPPRGRLHPELRTARAKFAPVYLQYFPVALRIMLDIFVLERNVPSGNFSIHEI